MTDSSSTPSASARPPRLPRRGISRANSERIFSSPPTEPKRGVSRTLSNNSSHSQSSSPPSRRGIVRSLSFTLSSPKRGIQRTYSPRSTLQPLNLRSCLKDGPSTESKSVSFDEISIHEHPVVLGDNPAVTDGAPIQIGWKSQKDITMDIDKYESKRGEKRRSKKRLAIPVTTRAKLLLRAGYTLQEIAQATLQATEDKNSRIDSVQKQNWDRFNIMMETTGKTFKRMVGSRTTLIEESARTA